MHSTQLLYKVKLCNLCILEVVAFMCILYNMPEKCIVLISMECPMYNWSLLTILYLARNILLTYFSSIASSIVCLEVVSLWWWMCSIWYFYTQILYTFYTPWFRTRSIIKTVPIEVLKSSIENAFRLILWSKLYRQRATECR